MSQHARVRVGVIGCGTVSQVMHLPYLRSLPELFDIVAISDLSAGLVASLGETYGVPADRRYTDYRELVASDLDAVLVLNSGSHAPQVLAAVEAGKHVLVEKPLCFTLREADAIQEAADRTGATVMVAYMKRFDPGYLYGLAQVKSMTDIRYVQINTLHPSEDQYTDIHGVRRCDDVSREQSQALAAEQDALLVEAVGPVSDVLRFVYYDVFLGSMVHDVNAVRALVGEPEAVLFAECWPAGSTTPSVTTVLQHPNDVRTTYTWTYLDEVRDYFEEIAVMAPDERVRIQFPSPFLKHWPTPVVRQHMEDGVLLESRIQVSYDEAFQEELRAFHTCVVTGEAPLTTVADARADIACLQQIFAAMQPEGLGGEALRSVAVPA